jgi:hypothetical protein
VNGKIDVGSNATTTGAGANPTTCTGHAPANGRDDAGGGGGGGGGGLAGIGGKGGVGNNQNNSGGVGGIATTAALAGGCPGARGGNGIDPGGTFGNGGGAIQLARDGSRSQV